MSLFIHVYNVTSPCGCGIWLAAHTPVDIPAPVHIRVSAN